jgi:RNA polymerase sigma-70 factor (ECF subfamily)
VYRLALNVSLTLLKKKKNNPQLFTSEFPQTEDVESSPVFADEALNDLYDAIKRLSDVDRGVVLLYLEEKSYQQIADITGTNPNNIGVRITRIKERLKKLMDGKVN